MNPIYEIPENIKRIKIDVGLSYSAPQSEVWLSHEPDLFVFGFEPHPESAQCIKNGSIVQKPGHGKPLSDENAKRFCLIPVALGNVSAPTTMDFYMMNNDCGTSSLFAPNATSLGGIKQIVQVPVHNLSEFLDSFPWERFPHIEYLKIDAQGSDLDILKGAGRYLSERFIYITAEPDQEMYLGAKNSVQDITDFMTSVGFTRVFNKNTSDPTFLNSKFAHLAESIFVYQRG
jgi:FkbM family methyltransferase